MYSDRAHDTSSCSSHKSTSEPPRTSRLLCPSKRLQRLWSKPPELPEESTGSSTIDGQNRPSIGRRSNRLCDGGPRHRPHAPYGSTHPGLEVDPERPLRVKAGKSRSGQVSPVCLRKRTSDLRIL